jgi:peptidoglycan/xylan/chitin deacetylase (PgdA/CDA1 family)
MSDVFVSSLPILTFHALDDRPSVISFPAGLFRRAMAQMSERGFQTLDLLEAVDRLRRGVAFPPRSLVITFDDGYRSVYEEAFPILERHGMCATVFLTVGEEKAKEPASRLPSLNGRSMLSWSEIREMNSASMAVGAHTLTHPDLSKAPENRIEVEMCQSKEIIEDALGVPVASFAYPYGRFGGRSLAIARQHFACACSDRLGLIGPESDPHMLARVDAYYLRSDRLVDLVGTRLFPRYISALGVARRMRRRCQFSSR